MLKFTVAVTVAVSAANAWGQDYDNQSRDTIGYTGAGAYGKSSEKAETYGAQV